MQRGRIADQNNFKIGNSVTVHIAQYSRVIVGRPRQIDSFVSQLACSPRESCVSNELERVVLLGADFGIHRRQVDPVNANTEIKNLVACTDD